MHIVALCGEKEGGWGGGSYAICRNTHTHTYAHTHTYTYTYTYTHTRMNTCVCACVFICIYMHIPNIDAYITRDIKSL